MQGRRLITLLLFILVSGLVIAAIHLQKTAMRCGSRQ